LEKSKRLERTVKEKRVLNTTSVKDGYDRKREQEVKREEGINEGWMVDSGKFGKHEKDR